MLPDIEPHLEDVTDRQAALFDDSPEYAFVVPRNTHVNIRAVFLGVARKA
jgi:hypothetical protein